MEAPSGQNWLIYFATSNIYFATIKIYFQSLFISFYFCYTIDIFHIAR